VLIAGGGVDGSGGVGVGGGCMWLWGGGQHGFLSLVGLLVDH